MAEQHQQHQKPRRPAYPGGTLDDASKLRNDDSPRHAPESGDPTETGHSRAPDLAGDRDESGRQGGDAK